MNKSIIAILVAIVLGGGVIAYVATGGFGNTDDPAAQQTDEQTAEQQTEQQSGTESQSLLQRVFSGQASITCNYVADGYEGVAYLKSNQDYSIEQQGEDGTWRMIRLGDKIYLWRVDQNEGYVIDATAFDEELEEQFNVFTPESFENEAETDEIDCRETGSFDEDLFTLPDDVNFISLEEYFQQLQDLVPQDNM